MTSPKPLAVCNRRRGRHTLVRLAERDGEAVFEYRAAVAGLAVQRGKPRGEFNIADSWTYAPITEFGSAECHCGPCGQDFLLDFGRLLPALHAGNAPLVLQPVPPR